jgi:cytochrome c553
LVQSTEIFGLKIDGARLLLRRFLAVGAALTLLFLPLRVLAEESEHMAERVLACAPCHGATGEGSKDPYFPRLAGKPAVYLSSTSSWRFGMVAGATHR